MVQVIEMSFTIYVTDRLAVFMYPMSEKVFFLFSFTFKILNEFFRQDDVGL